jgi:hypothetical protein
MHPVSRRCGGQTRTEWRRRAQHLVLSGKTPRRHLDGWPPAVKRLYAMGRDCAWADLRLGSDSASRKPAFADCSCKSRISCASSASGRERIGGCGDSHDCPPAHGHDRVALRPAVAPEYKGAKRNASHEAPWSCWRLRIKITLLARRESRCGGSGVSS